MDNELFEHSLLSLEQRYADLLALHEARLKSNSLELEQVSAAAKLEIEELRQQLEAKSVELQNVASECDARAKEKGEASRLLRS